MARKFADDLDAGEYGEGRTALVVLHTDEALHCFGWGEFDRLQTIGLLEAAKIQHIEAFHDGE